MSKHDKAKAIQQGITKGFINAYVCENLHSLVTKNIDNGFIPQAIACPQCNANSYSMSYNVNQELPHQMEWFKPNEAELQAMSLNLTNEEAKTMRHHVQQGGLASRLSTPNSKNSN